MSKISNPQELTDRLQAILRKASTGVPMRAILAQDLKQVAEDLEAEGQDKQAAKDLDIEEDDTVRLISGGPKMKVFMIRGTNVDVIWKDPDTGERLSARYKMSQLIKVA